jgi:hypothetical protein
MAFSLVFFSTPDEKTPAQRLSNDLSRGSCTTAGASFSLLRASLFPPAYGSYYPARKVGVGRVSNASVSCHDRGSERLWYRSFYWRSLTERLAMRSGWHGGSRRPKVFLAFSNCAWREGEWAAMVVEPLSNVMNQVRSPERLQWVECSQSALIETCSRWQHARLFRTAGFGQKRPVEQLFDGVTLIKVRNEI